MIGNKGAGSRLGETSTGRRRCCNTNFCALSAECGVLLFGRLASCLLLLLFSLLPTGIGVVFLHGFGENIGLLAEILLDTRLHPGQQ